MNLTHLQVTSVFEIHAKVSCHICSEGSFCEQITVIEANVMFRTKQSFFLMEIFLQVVCVNWF